MDSAQKQASIEQNKAQIWLTSDTHFSHLNIIKYCNRPYSSIEEMDDAILSAWETKVQPNDFVLHLGDVTIKKTADKLLEQTRNRLSKLPGQKILIYGNHDSAHIRVFLEQHGWHVIDMINTEGCCYIHDPKNASKNTNQLIIHGHTHGGFAASNHIDVGVDALNKKTILTDAATILSTTQHAALLKLIKHIKSI